MPLLARLTVPVGVDAPTKAVSVTVIVHVVAWFSATEEGEQTTDVAVASLPKLIEADP